MSIIDKLKIKPQAKSIKVYEVKIKKAQDMELPNIKSKLVDKRDTKPFNRSEFLKLLKGEVTASIQSSTVSLTKKSSSKDKDTKTPLEKSSSTSLKSLITITNIRRLDILYKIKYDKISFDIQSVLKATKKPTSHIKKATSKSVKEELKSDDFIFKGEFEKLLPKKKNL
jgi:hypothetical protein